MGWFTFHGASSLGGTTFAEQVKAAGKAHNHKACKAAGIAVAGPLSKMQTLH